MLSYDELTSPERELWDAFPEARRVDLRTGAPEDDRAAEGGQWGPGRTVRGAVIVTLLLTFEGALLNGRPTVMACPWSPR